MLCPGHDELLGSSVRLRITAGRVRAFASSRRTDWNIRSPHSEPVENIEPDPNAAAASAM